MKESLCGAVHVEDSWGVGKCGISEPQHDKARLDAELAAGQDVLDLLLDRVGVATLAANVAVADLILL